MQSTSKSMTTGYFWGLISFVAGLIIFTIFMGKKINQRFEPIKREEEKFDLQDTDEDIPNLYELDRDDEDDIMGQWDEQKLGA